MLPIKIAVKKLCSNEAKMFTADVVLEALLNNLKKHNSSIAKKLFDSVLKRVLERRQENLCSIARFLNNSDGYQQLKNDSILPYLSKTKIYEETAKICSRLYEGEALNDDEANNEDELEIVIEPTEQGFEAEKVLAQGNNPTKKKKHCTTLLASNVNTPNTWLLAKKTI